jgi:hypothetical protein
MKRRVIRAPVVRAFCQRCTKPFRYAHKTKPRLYCKPCVKQNAKDSNEVSNRFQKEMRRRARETSCHA